MPNVSDVATKPTFLYVYFADATIFIFSQHRCGDLPRRCTDLMTLMTFFAGIGSFTIIDGKRITGEDCGNNFFLDPNCIGESKAKVRSDGYYRAETTCSGGSLFLLKHACVLRREGSVA